MGLPKERANTPDLSQQIKEDIESVQSKINSLQESVRLSSTREAVATLQTTVTGLAQRISGFRGRGYVFEKGLEGQADTFAKSWTSLFPNLQTQINVQSSTLENNLRPIETQMQQLAASAGNPAAAQSLLTTVQSAVNQLEEKASAAGRAIDGMYEQINSQVSALGRHLDDVDYLLNQVAQATFQLLPTEAGIAATKAVWCKTGKEQKGDPEGVLYVTDQRLIFEQKEEVATKKVLFVATEKQKVQQMLFETPVALVDKVETSKQGLLKNEDHIQIRFSPGGPMESAHLHIWKDNAAWQALINRARIKDFDADRAVPIDQSALDKVKAAPSQCPSCGGNLSALVLRGQDSITCQYCGFVIRL